MRWIYCIVTSFLIGVAQLQAASGALFTTEDEEFLKLDSEIEAFLEEETYEVDQNKVFNLKEYDHLEEKEVQRSPLAPLSVQEVPKKEKIDSLPVEFDQLVAKEEAMITSHPNKETVQNSEPIQISLRQVFLGSPVVYSILFVLSTFAMGIWLYSTLTIRSIEFLPPKLISTLRSKLMTCDFEEALELCVKEKHFFCKMVASALLSRKHGLNVMLETMKAEGKRSTISFWQRLSLLNDIAIIAPMLGLLGTVLGMFYAFYDLNRSIESISLLFDGLGISVGTTVAGLSVAILAMLLHSLTKYRLVKVLATVDNEAQTFATLIDTREPSYLK